MPGIGIRGLYSSSPDPILKELHCRTIMKANHKVTLYYQPVIIDDVVKRLGNHAEYKNLVKPAHLNKIKHFISYLYLKPIVDSRYDNRFDFVHISSAFMVEMYTRQIYKPMLNGLLQAGIIERSEKKYKVGERTYAYRISPEYAGLNFQAVQCDRKLAEKQNEYRTEKIKEEKGFHNKKVLDKLEIIFRTITINREAAEKYLLDKLIYSLKNPETIDIEPHDYHKNGKYTPNRFDDLTRDQEKKLGEALLAEVRSICGKDVFISHNISLEKLTKLMDRYNSHMISIERIDVKDFNFRDDKTAGRLHTNLTNFPSDLKQFLKLEGQPLVGRDLISSQPVFLSCMMLKKYKKTEMPDDVFRFIQLCLDGGKQGDADIYTYIMHQHGITDRKQFKTQFYKQVLFGRVPCQKFPEVTKAFIAEFPSVWAFILQQKSDVKKYGDKAHAQLAINLQKHESKLFIGAAADVMNRGIKVLTLHDALYVIDTPENIALADEIILSRFMEKYGVVPTLSV